MKVGFIGLGQMGVRMAANVQNAGFEMVVYDVNKASAAPLLEKGAAWADSPAAVADACRVVITSLPTPPIVENVVLGENGLCEKWRSGDVYIDTSTNSPELLKKIASIAESIGVEVLDSPVSGGIRGAEAGTLSLIIGGKAETLEKVRPILEPMSANIFHMGEVGCGNVAKLVNNLTGLIVNSACGEGMALGARGGIDPQKLYDMMIVSTADSWSLRQYDHTVFVRNFEPGFKVALAHKDITLALGLAEEYGLPLPVAKAAQADLANLMAIGLGDKGVDSVVIPHERITGVEVKPFGK